MNTRKYKSLLPAYLVGLAAGKYTLAQAAGACGYSVVRMCQLKKSVFTRGLGETMPQVVADIIYRYMFAYAKEVSA